jgi:hypothetical protein
MAAAAAAAPAQFDPGITCRQGLQQAAQRVLSPERQLILSAATAGCCNQQQQQLFQQQHQLQQLQCAHPSLGQRCGSAGTAAVAGVIMSAAGDSSLAGFVIQYGTGRRYLCEAISSRPQGVLSFVGAGTDDSTVIRWPLKAVFGCFEAAVAVVLHFVLHFVLPFVAGMWVATCCQVYPPCHGHSDGTAMGLDCMTAVGSIGKGACAPLLHRGRPLQLLHTAAAVQLGA